MGTVVMLSRGVPVVLTALTLGHRDLALAAWWEERPAYWGQVFDAIDARTPTPEPATEMASDRNNSVKSLPSASVISQPDFKSDSFQHIFNQNTNNHSQDDKDSEDEGAGGSGPSLSGLDVPIVPKVSPPHHRHGNIAARRRAWSQYFAR